MKKIQKFSIVFLLLPVLLSGTTVQRRYRKQPVVKLVTQVDIFYKQEDSTLIRHYTHPKKIEPVLDYLRLLQYRGKADVDPERLSADAYEIKLSYSDGMQRIYRQRSNRYISKDNRPWEMIDPEQGSMLYTLLQAIPSDL